MIYVIDLDGTLCTNTNGEYEKATPFVERIEKVNKLYDEGHKIKIETARGSTTNIDWFKLTENQLKDWGVKYCILRVGVKMDGDIFIDDKAMNDKDFFE